MAGQAARSRSPSSSVKKRRKEEQLETEELSSGVAESGGVVCLLKETCLGLADSPLRFCDGASGSSCSPFPFLFKSQSCSSLRDWMVLIGEEGRLTEWRRRVGKEWELDDDGGDDCEGRASIPRGSHRRWKFPVLSSLSAFASGYSRPVSSSRGHWGKVGGVSRVRGSQ